LEVGAVRTVRRWIGYAHHFDNDGVPRAPKTLWLGSAKAVAQHVANHTVANGHDGNDYAGQRHA
jgi:hypothetical protein